MAQVETERRAWRRTARTGEWGGRWSPLEAALIPLGVLCVIAAIVGGGLQGAGYTLPAIGSWPREVALGAVGVVLTLGGRLALDAAGARGQVACARRQRLRLSADLRHAPGPYLVHGIEVQRRRDKEEY
jgi:hypothetical protein